MEPMNRLLLLEALSRRGSESGYDEILDGWLDWKVSDGKLTVMFQSGEDGTESSFIWSLNDTA